MQWPWSRRGVYVDVVMGRGENAPVERFLLDPRNQPYRLWAYIGLDNSLNVSNGDPDKRNIQWQ